MIFFFREFREVRGGERDCPRKARKSTKGRDLIFIFSVVRGYYILVHNTNLLTVAFG